MADFELGHALYYPFSRCINAASMKHMLLLFDSVSFVDPVIDDEWRIKLFRDVEVEQPKFKQYREISDCMPYLRKSNVIRVIEPKYLKTLHSDVTVSATLSDISDLEWVNAANPIPYKLASQYDPTKQLPAWQIFQPKIPSKVLSELMDGSFPGHVYEEGTERSAWTLSYAAGSAIGINTHLAAAEEQGLAPVTDSSLHHRLMLMKLVRGSGAKKSKPSSDPALAEEVARGTVTQLINQVLPQESMENLSLEDILKFREESASLRRAVMEDMLEKIEKELKSTDAESALRLERSIAQRIKKEVQTYQAELGSLRDRLWPNLIGSTTSKVAIGSAGAGLAISYINSAGFVLAASIIAAALQPVKVALEYRAAVAKVRRSAAPPIAYLAKLNDVLKR